jgi:large subunit ribosomal protein L15
MQIHEVARPDWLKEKKRIGRGGKRGTYSGKGNKGQKSRSGGNIPPGFEGQDTTLVQRSPKLRGFTSPKLPNIAISLDLLEKNFTDKDKVSPQILIEKRLIKLNKRSRARKLARVKILANGKISKALTIEGCLVSQGAKAAIEKAGGGITEDVKKA